MFRFGRPRRSLLDPEGECQSRTKGYSPCVIHPTIFKALLTTLVPVGKSASLSQAALSAMNIDVDTSRLLDIVSPFTTRTLKDRKNSAKENLSKTVSPAPEKRPDMNSDFIMVEDSEVLKKAKVNPVDRSSSLTAAAPSSKIKHTRSQSQPKVATRSGSSLQFFRSCPANQQLAVVNLSELSTTSKPVMKAPVFVPLEPIKGSTTPDQVVNKSATVPSRAALSPVNTSNTIKVRSASGKENATVKEPRVSKYKAPNENSLVRTPSGGRSKKPLGPRKPPPTLTPEKKKKKAAGNENTVSPRDPSTTSTRGTGRVLADLSNSKANPNVLGAKSRNSVVNSAFTSPDRIASFFTSPDTTDLSVNLNIHGDSYATESVWLNRTTETAGKNQNESSFASLGKGSVKERWMDWERERERLREMDKDKIRETDDEDTNRHRMSILSVASEQEPNTGVPLETDVDATLEFAPLCRPSEESSRLSGLLEMKGNVVDTAANAEEKQKEPEPVAVSRRRDSQGSRILQTLLAAEPVTVLSPRVQSGRCHIHQTLGALPD